MNNIPSDIVELLNKYSDTKQDGSYLNDYLSRVSDSKPVIPVLGMQGTGKSTLINALLEENILPTEADETTCVPVEIKYGENEHADVFFKDSNESKVVHTIEELQEYVDNNFNPGNEKKVTKIILFRKNDILKNGTIIVDLPGVGSLTAANEETTNNYIQNLCSAIFVIPTVPTIRKNEALFIKSVWSQFSSAIFVQNDWGESKQEIAESVAYNTKLLRGIAKELNNKFDNEILVVNAYNAIAGSLRKDVELRESSNVSALNKTIDGFSANWNKVQTESAKDKTIMTIDSAIKSAQRVLKEFSQSQEETIRSREAELQDMQNATNKLEEEISKVKSFVSQQEFVVRSSARSKASDCIKKIRAAMNKTIDSGVFDGDALTTTFNDEQQEKVTECLNSLFDEITQIKIEIDSRIHGLCEIALNDDLNARQEEIHKDHQFRYEIGIDWALKLGGGLGGYFAAGATTAGIAAAVAKGALEGTVFTPGVGTAIGAAVGLVVGLVGVAVGGYAKKKVQTKRANETKEELEPYYIEIETAIKKTIGDKYGDYSNNLQKALDAIILTRRNRELKFKENLFVFENAEQAKVIENDIIVLTNFKKSF